MLLDAVVLLYKDWLPKAVLYAPVELVYKEKVPTEERKSTLNLDALLNMAGIPDEPEPHNALNGALSAAEVYFRLIEGREVLPEFKDFKFL